MERNHLPSSIKAVVKKSLFPTKKPTYPKLVQFRPVQALALVTRILSL